MISERPRLLSVASRRSSLEVTLNVRYARDIVASQILISESWGHLTRWTKVGTRLAELDAQ